MKSFRKKIDDRRGFTIVELLIVIVVIAILAAISIVAYNGIQQRASNTAIISAVNQTIKAVQLYYAQEGSYPLTGTYACVTSTTGCIETGGVSRDANATFDANIAKAANVPRSVPNVGAAGNGIIYSHHANRQVDGESRPVLIMYFLNGQSQKCGIPNIMTAWGIPSQEATWSTTGYTSNNPTNNKTVCYTSVL